MRSLKSYRAEEQTAENDDRELRSRSDERRDRRNTEDALEDLARKLVDLRDKQLKKLELPETVAFAVYEGKAIKSHTARKRQLRTIRRELRVIDWQGLQLQVERIEFPARFGHMPDETRAGQWLQRLTLKGDPAVTELLRETQTLDRQRLRQLLRVIARDGTPKAKKNLLEYLRQELPEQANG